MSHDGRHSVGLVWFSSELYAEARLMMDDSDRLPVAFEDWECGALRRERQLLALGCEVVRAFIQPGEFREYCAVNALPADTRARHDYAACIARAHDLQWASAPLAGQDPAVPVDGHVGDETQTTLTPHATRRAGASRVRWPGR